MFLERTTDATVCPRQGAARKADAIGKQLCGRLSDYCPGGAGGAFMQVHLDNRETPSQHA